jgi:O-phosphoseryl-tRNA(Cys) synthetase
MKFDVKDIKARGKLDFEATWLETAKLLPEKIQMEYV